MKPAKTRKEARDRKLPRYQTGKPCPRGHNVERYTSSGQCVTCQREAVKRWQHANPERMKEYRWKIDPDARREYFRQWYAKNRDRLIEKKRAARARGET